MLVNNTAALIWQWEQRGLLYPGMPRVVQAAGRVIRTTTDQGVLHLMDERYGRVEVRSLLPRWWGESVGSNRRYEESSRTPK